MNLSQKVERYWDQFLDSLPGGAERPGHFYEAFYFGTTPESAGQITPLVLSGTKTATGSLLWVYEAEGRQPPQAGDYNVITDGSDPVCVILDTEIRVLPYDEVDAGFAWDGGEEDRTLESWRRIYWDYILLECARIGRQPAQKTPLVCERFRVVYQEPLKTE